MEQEMKSIKFAVMRRVRFVYFARKFFEPRNVKIGLIILFVAVESFLVSIPHVLTNLVNILKNNFGDVNAMYSFLSSAFLQTQISVQILTLGIFAVCLFFAMDILKVSREAI